VKRRSPSHRTTFIWPAKGIDVGGPFSAPSPISDIDPKTNIRHTDPTRTPNTDDAMNVRTYDPATDRARGAQRPGWSHFLGMAIGGGSIQNIVQVLGYGGVVVVSPSPPEPGTPGVPGDTTGGDDSAQL
jgi:hypothetical protein